MKKEMAEYYPFPKTFKTRSKNAAFVFIQDYQHDPFQPLAPLLDRAPMTEIKANYIVVETANPKIKADTHVFLGLPGLKNGFVRAYVHKKEGKTLYIGCMSGELLT